MNLRNENNDDPEINSKRDTFGTRKVTRYFTSHNLTDSQISETNIAISC